MMMMMCRRWVMFIEKSICDIDGKLVIHHETLKKLKRRLEIIQQTYDAPVVYAQAVHEVVRRRLFASQFLQVRATLYRYLRRHCFVSRK